MVSATSVPKGAEDRLKSRESVKQKPVSAATA